MVISRKLDTYKSKKNVIFNVPKLTYKSNPKWLINVIFNLVLLHMRHVFKEWRFSFFCYGFWKGIFGKTCCFIEKQCGACISTFCILWIIIQNMYNYAQLCTIMHNMKKYAYYAILITHKYAHYAQSCIIIDNYA